MGRRYDTNMNAMVPRMEDSRVGGQGLEDVFPMTEERICESVVEAEVVAAGGGGGGR